MLNVAVNGHTATSIDTAGRRVGELWLDREYENLRKIPSPISGLPKSDSTGSMSSQAKMQSPASESVKSLGESDSVKLAGRLVSRLQMFTLFY